MLPVKNESERGDTDLELDSAVTVDVICLEDVFSKLSCVACREDFGVHCHKLRLVHLPILRVLVEHSVPASQVRRC